MNDNIRLERIHRLVRELQYEVTRGVMEREIEPDMNFRISIPGGPTGSVGFWLTISPEERGAAMARPRLVEARDSGRLDPK